MLVVFLVALLQVPQKPAPAPSPATVRGTISDAASGKPVRMARVFLTPEGRIPGATQRGTRSDERGVFELLDVAPGRYKLAAAKAGYASTELGQSTFNTPGRSLTIAAGAALERVDVALLRAAAITGRIVDDLGEPIQGAHVTAYKPGYDNRGPTLVQANQAVTNDRGDYRIAQLPPGEYFVAAQERGAGFGSQADADIGLAVTAYPAATTRRAARPVTVRAGADTVAIDIAMAPVTAGSLTGIVLDSAAQPARGVDLMLQPVTPGIGGGVGGAARTGNDGAFTFPNLIPARYELHARHNIRPNEGTVFPITIAPGEHANVTVPVTRGGRMRGAVILPEGASLNPGALRISAVPVGDTLIYGTGFGGPIAADWSFDWDFLLGPRIIRATTLPDGWYIKSVLRGDTDVTDEPVVFKGTEVVDNLRIVLTMEKTVLTGRAIDSGGKPATDYTAIVFAEDAARWDYWSRFVATARPDQAGDFAIEGLPAGKYLVAAVDGVENNQWRDKAFLERLRAVATPLTLDANQTATISLKVVKP
jgi:uncharacterized protein (DUF2141 family)